MPYAIIHGDEWVVKIVLNVDCLVLSAIIGWEMLLN